MKVQRERLHKQPAEVKEGLSAEKHLMLTDPNTCVCPVMDWPPVQVTHKVVRINPSAQHSTP